MRTAVVLALAACVLTACTVTRPRMHEVVFGATADGATIGNVTYYLLAADNSAHGTLDDVGTPWSRTERSRSRPSPTMGVQASGAVSCSITVDGRVVSQRDGTGYVLCSGA